MRATGFPSVAGWLRRAAALAVGLFLLAQVAPGSAQTTQEKLDQAKGRLRRIQKELDTQQAKLDSLRAEITSLTTQIQQATYQAKDISSRIGDTKTVIKRKGKRVNRLQGRLDERAREAYIRGPGGALELILEAESLTELSDRVTFLSTLSQADADTAAGVQVEREELRRFRDDLEVLLQEQEELLDELGGQKRVLDKKFAQEVAIRERIAARFAEAEEVVQDLRKQLRRELLAALRAARSSAPIDASGLLKWCPVDQPRSYINDFGFPRSGGRTHQGNDIFAPAGTAIRAPFAGVADEGSNSLGGLSVYVRAPDGTYVYNAHMSRYAGVDGKQVKPGDLIGYVGNTGNAVGTPPHNHFELHPGGGGAVNPYAFLNAVCGVNGSG